jgi:GWxTD domain-containing protein
MMRRTAAILPALVLMLAGLTACYYYRQERKLDAVNKDWLSQVGYIITSEERRLFLDLPDAEKDAFKEEFWLRRDPDPSTEENEFRMEYYDRIERADEMFHGEVRPGYLTDRGRIYILFGAPFSRLTYPADSTGKAREVWHYGNFPVVFVNEFNSGRFELVTYSLSGMREFSLIYMHELNLAQARAQETVQGDDSLFNFNWEAEVEARGPDRVTGEVKIEIALGDVWFSDREGRTITTMDLHLEIYDTDDTLVWEYERAYEIELDEKEAGPKTKHTLIVPLDIQVPVSRLQKGINKIFAELTNRTGESRLRKVKTFRLK